MLISQILRGVQETIYILASAAVEYDFRQRARIPKELQQACELRRVFERQGSYELVAAVAAPQAAGGIEDIGLVCKERYLDILDCLTTVAHLQEMQACLRDILTLLWHPNGVISPTWWNLYLRNLEYLKEKNAWFGSVRGIGEDERRVEVTQGL